jgi:O-antigen biosynthesis protein
MLREDGERFLPWMADPVVNYEHLHRYRAVADLVAGRRVIDLASGEGYGSALLGEAAASVIGVELDHAAVVHASVTYRAPRLRFVEGSIAEVPLRGQRFDVVVCFEALEHVEEQDALCAEAARLLVAGGLFVVSTPNREVYSEGPGGFQNPFHVRELDLEEFATLLRRHFAQVRLFGQRVYPVSAIFPLGEPVSGAREYVIAREPGAAAFRFADAARKAPRYFIALASNGPIAAGPGPGGFLLDASEQLFEVQRRSEGAVAELERHLATREGQVVEVERELQRLARHIGTLEADIAAQRPHIQDLERQLRAAGETIAALEADRAALEAQRAALQARQAALEAHQAAMEATRTWRLHLRLERARVRARRLLGRGAG